MGSTSLQQPGNLTNNACTEEIYRRFRHVWFNENSFPSLEGTMGKAESRRKHYNGESSQSTRDHMFPRGFAVLVGTAD